MLPNIHFHPSCWEIAIRELKMEKFSGRRQFRSDVTSWFVQYCAYSRSPHCRRAPVGDVKLVGLALWREREYLTFISIRFVAFSNQNVPDYRSLRGPCFLWVTFQARSALDLQALLSKHRVKIESDPIWQTANRKWGLHGQNCPTSQMKVSRKKVWTPIF